MKKRKWSKGPWEACCTDNLEYGSHYVFEENGQSAVCQMISHVNDEFEIDLPIAKKNINAQLIAFAPEMAELIMEWAKTFDDVESINIRLSEMSDKLRLLNGEKIDE